MKNESQHTPGPIALGLANSFVPFMQRPPAANYVTEVRDNIAKDIQRALETYWPTMAKERDELKTINAELLEALEDCMKLLPAFKSVLGEPTENIESIAAYKKAKSAIAKVKALSS